MPLLHLVGEQSIFLRQVRHLATILEHETRIWAAVNDLPDHVDAVFVCHEDSAQRIEVLNANPDLPFTNLIHPSAIVSTTADLGLNLFMDAAVVVGMDAQLGSGVVLNARTTVEHDNLLAEGVFMGTGATLCGHVTIDAGCFIGGGVTVKPLCHIHKDITVGTGTVVVKDLIEPGAYAGNPAKLLERSKS